MSDIEDGAANSAALHREALLGKWQEDSDPVALDELLRTEVLIIKDLIQAKGQGMLLGSAGASDIAQEAVLKMLEVESIPKFADASALRGYLWVTAWRLLLQRVRRPYRRKLSIDSGTSSQPLSQLEARGGENPEAADERSALAFAMNLLPSEDQQLLHAVYFEGRSISDLCAQTSLSESAMKMRLLRARRSLAARLTSWEKTIG